jgi:hypothetical protein
MQRIFNEHGLDCIFEGIEIPIFQKDGTRHHFRKLGFHYEDSEVMQARGIVIDERTRTAPDTNGVYRARITVQGVEWNAREFFPRYMARNQIVEAIINAYSSRVVVDCSQHLYVGGGRSLRVYMVLDKDDLIVDAYPKRRKVGKNSEALFKFQNAGVRSKRLCRVCFQPRVLTCPVGHMAKRCERESRFVEFIKRMESRVISILHR